MERVGLGLGYSPELTVNDMSKWVIDAEERGFELTFFSETIMTMRDAITSLTAFSVRTSRMRFGCTQILRIRTPLVIAQTFTSLNEISGGRVILSVGACTDSHARKHGLPLQNPAKVLKEHATLIKKYWENETVSFKGETIEVEGEGLAIRPKSKIPLLLASTSRTGLRIAGEVGDGVVVNATTSPEYARNALAVVKQAAEAAGRNFNDFIITGLVVSGVTDGTKEAENALRWELASKFDPLQVDFAVRPRIRVGEPVVTEALIQKLSESYRIGGKEKLAQDIPEDVIRSLTAFGTAREVRERVEEYRKAGVQLPIVRPASSKLMKSVMDAVS
ncbi:MAG: LLM class flavin-dependent oxidoreductase [Thaumarchaeota archaeon]|nr:LLM class flavin-dependent oxidoreductase [Nitrososphaerota archaeon]